MNVSSLPGGMPRNPAGSKLVMAEWTAPGTPQGRSPDWIAPLHSHRNDDEAWYVLEGRLGFRIGEDTVYAGANEAVVVPSGTPHTYWNSDPEASRYLIIMTANVSALIEVIHATPQRDADFDEGAVRQIRFGAIYLISIANVPEEAPRFQ